MTQSPASAERASARHPKGLYLLFASELWERASFYGMRALLVLHTVGELCLSPVGLALTTKLAPKLAGFIGGKASKYGDLTIFAGLAVATAVAGLLLFALSRMMIRMMHGADETKPLKELPERSPDAASAPG